MISFESRLFSWFTIYNTNHYNNNTDTQKPNTEVKSDDKFILKILETFLNFNKIIKCLVQVKKWFLSIKHGIKLLIKFITFY